MKLDLNKEWIKALVSNTSTANGCSFIRGVILRYVGISLLWIVGVSVALFIIAALLGGAYMWCVDSSFFNESVDKITYFGDMWYHSLWGVMCLIGGVFDLLAVCATIIFGSGWLIAKSVTKTKPALATGVRKIWDTISVPEPLKEAVNAWYHKFCPQIEFILPKGFEGYVVGARIGEVRWSDWNDEEGRPCGEKTLKMGTITTVAVKGCYMKINVLWDADAEQINERFADPEYIGGCTPEEVAALKESALYYRQDMIGVWFNHSNTEYELVEESPSPL